MSAAEDAAFQSQVPMDTSYPNHNSVQGMDEQSCRFLSVWAEELQATPVVFYWPNDIKLKHKRTGWDGDAETSSLQKNDGREACYSPKAPQLLTSHALAGLTIGPCSWCDRAQLKPSPI